MARDNNGAGTVVVAYLRDEVMKDRLQARTLEQLRSSRS